MFRRLGAVAGMVAIIALLLALMWRIYLHHERDGGREEPAIVSLEGSAEA